MNRHNRRAGSGRRLWAVARWPRRWAGGSSARPAGFLVVGTGSGRIHVTLGGDLDVTILETLAELLAGLADRQPTGLRIDMSKVSFLDCACAGLLIGTARLLPPGEYPVLVSVQPMVRRLLELLGLADFIETGE